MFEAIKPLGPFVVISYTLHPFFKTSRFQDDDNISGGFKATRDGIADACRQDDRTFKCAGVFPAKDASNPRLEVVITIEELI